jgi:hypothetical protein
VVAELDAMRPIDGMKEQMKKKKMSLRKGTRSFED